MRKLWIFVLSVLLICGCRAKSDSANSREDNSIDLTVSAAVSLKDAFNEVAAQFKQKTGTNVTFNFGASGTLQKQIETGAPVDLFASAGEKQMDELDQKGLIDTQSRRGFARNTLVLIVTSESKLNLTGFTDLTKSTVIKIAAGNPKTVPAGQYTDQLLTKINIKDGVLPKLVFAEDVRQVLDYVSRGEVDAGIVYATDARVAGAKVRVVATAPVDSQDPILYPMAVIKDSQHKSAAEAFAAFILGPEGQAVLQKYGFGNAEK